ncbi:amino acid permease [Limnofasciculus baicalensis]|uniref:Amino acid permease n=1 Tax=Limnofasciculus baicalensis BBK-W-15 TaxID=2699891 RepID=A0AAE3GRW0_9CYAN|nr:amino acid permease [Limnofasciculus baicalensis]MCP2728718.1 amino acid permease [Limnofasciculus baicalensis BBK-W-15]
MKTGLFAKKSVASLLQQAEDSTSQGLERSLNVFNLTALGIGTIIGAGIFVLTGQVAANYTGPAIALSFVIAAISCGFVGLCYAEFASIIPIAGSTYTYAYATLGEIFAWMIGWVLLLEYALMVATVAVGWSGYMTSFLKDIGITIPEYLLSANFNVPAMFIIALMTLFLAVGMRKSVGVNNLIVAVKLGVILLFIFVGIAYIKQENWLPFIPENTGEFGVFGLSGIWRGSGAIFFAYIGFDGITAAAQEAKNPEKDMPIALIASLVVSTILYISVALVLVGIVPYQQLNVPDPIAIGVDALGAGLSWLKFVVKIGAIAGLSSVILVTIMANSRIFYAIAYDGLLPPQFAQIHPEFKTPYLATIVSGMIAAILAGLFPINLLGELASFDALLAFFIISISVLILRRTQPDLVRPFKTPFVPFVPILGALTCGLQMLIFPVNTWLQLFAWLLIGLVIYFSYGQKNSLLNQGERLEVRG